MIDQTEDTETRLMRAHLAEYQILRNATAKAREATADVGQREAADYTIADLDRQIQRVIAWLAQREKYE